MFTEMANMANRHKNGADFFKKGEKYAPSFGMMGTVMGLIVMMNGFELEGKELSETMTDLLGNGNSAYNNFVWRSFGKFYFWTHSRKT